MVVVFGLRNILSIILNIPIPTPQRVHERGCHYNQALLFKTRLTNAQLAELTTL